MILTNIIQTEVKLMNGDIMNTIMTVLKKLISMLSEIFGKLGVELPEIDLDNLNLGE